MRASSKLSRVAAFWHQRSRREQRLLALAGGLALLALGFLLLIEPALQARERLHGSLPALRRQTAELQQLLASAPPPAAEARPATALSRPEIDAMLARFGLGAKQITVGPDGLGLELAGAPFPRVLELLDALRATGGLQVKQARLRATARPGLVDASLVLVTGAEP